MPGVDCLASSIWRLLWTVWGLRRDWTDLLCLEKRWWVWRGNACMAIYQIIIHPTMTWMNGHLLSQQHYQSQPGQLLQGMNETTRPTQRLRRILTDCSAPYVLPQEWQEFQQKSQEVDQSYEHLNESLARLSIALSNSSSNIDPKDEPKLTKINFNYFEGKRQLLRKKKPPARKQERFISLPSQSPHQKSLSRKQTHSSEASPKNQAGTPKSPYGLNDLKLPGLVLKVRLSKCPTNASRNCSIEGASSRARRTKEQETYQELRLERKRVEEMRHIVVLGKIMEENHRKERKILESRKKKNLLIPAS